MCLNIQSHKASLLERNSVVLESASSDAPAHQSQPPHSPQQQSLASLSGPPVEANRVEIANSAATCAFSMSLRTPGCLWVF